MYRNPEQEREYQRLSPKLKERYDYFANENPSRTHADVTQLMGMLDACTNALNKALDKGEKDIDINDNGTRKGILEGLRSFLEEKAPSVWANVKDRINRAIEYLEKILDWVEDNIVDPIVDFIDDIFSFL